MNKHTVVDVIEHEGRTQAHVSYSKVHAVGSGAFSNFPKATQPFPTLSPRPDDNTGGTFWEPWGDRPGRDDLPIRIRNKVYQVAIAGRTIYDLVRMAYGNGLAYYSNRERRESKKMVRHFEPKIERFLEDNYLANEWFKPQLADYKFLMNGYSEMILNKRKDQITHLFHKEAEYCRISLQNPASLRHEFLLYSGDFSLGRGTVHPDRIKALYLFPRYNGLQWIQNLPSHKFAWHTRLRTPGTIVYPMPFWLGLFRDKGWLDVSMAVPEVVYAMMRNQVRLKYQILIPESYFTIRYRDRLANHDR